MAEVLVAQKKPISTKRQVGRFGLVGLSNTVIDYTLFILVTSFFHIPLDRVWTGKLVSGTVAMINSFYWNRRWVFHHEKTDVPQELVRFITTTLIATYVIQTSLVQFFSTGFPAIGNFAYEVLQRIGLVSLMPGILTQAFVIKTVAFCLATAGSMTWNFTLYKKWAFR